MERTVGKGEEMDEMGDRVPGAAALVAGAIAILLWFGLAVPPAWAGYEEVGRFPRVSTPGEEPPQAELLEEESLGAMPLSGTSTGVATNDATGEVYVADGARARIERLSSEGRFLGAWGWNTIKTGPGKAGTSLEEMVTIKRISGGEDVVYKGEQKSETNPLSYEAEAKLVEEEIEKHLIIGTEREVPIKPSKGEVKVKKEGPGVYKFTYEGEGVLGDEESGEIGVVKAGLEGTITPEVKQGSPEFEDCTVPIPRETGHDFCRKPTDFGTRGGKPGEFSSPSSIAVDQANGDVYVLDPTEHEHNAVQVFTADGERTKTEFGESTTEKLGKVGESEKNPEKLRSATSIAVDSKGDSYIVNSGPSKKLESRISVFGPAGEYLGSMGRTCGAKSPTGCALNSVGVDSEGNVYTIGEEDQVYEFKHGSEPTVGPVCELPKKEEKEGIPNLETLAVDGPGEVVVYGSVSHEFYWFTACADEKFQEEPHRDFEDKAMPPAVRTSAIAWNPSLQYPATRPDYERPKGVFYAINPAATFPEVELNTGLIFAQEEEPIKEEKEKEEEKPPPPPKVVEKSVSGVGLTYANLNARIERYSDPVHYRFWYYSPEDPKCPESHECEAPMGGSEPVLKQGEEVVSQPVAGLVPGATYHFRVMGYSFCNSNPKHEEEECHLEDGVKGEFTTFPEGSVELPDGRAYELVSPPFKDGGEVFPPEQESINCKECLPGVGDEKFPMQSTPNGEEMVYEGEPFSATGEAANENEYFTVHTPEGWGASHDLSPATAVRDGQLPGYKAFSPDLSVGVFVQEGPSLSSEAPEQKEGGPAFPDIYLQSTSAPEDPRPLWTRADADLMPPHRGPEGTEKEELKFEVAGMAGKRAGEHVIFAANDALTPETAVAPPAVDGGPGADNLYDWMEGNLQLVNVLPGDVETQAGASFGSGTEFETTAGDPDYAHAISADGSHVFWTDNGTHHVYVRIDGEETIEVHDTGGFLTASADGSKVLLNDGHIYDVETQAVTADLTDGKGDFQGILGASEDLSKVYFVDTAELPGVKPNAYGGKAAKGADNLYLWQEGSPTRYIATLSAGDDHNGGVMYLTAAQTGDWVASPSDRTAQVSPDGRYVAFMSEAALTGYDNAPASGKCGEFGPVCDEVFEYDAESNGLVCVSCNPTKERPVGSSTLSLIKPGSGFMAQPSNLSEDGRVFFDSGDVLSPQDQHPGVENVYEYEPDGIGSCDGREAGCIFMISTGMEETDSSFVNATPSGSNVFFTTRSRLVPQDQDELVDLYDAREGGGGFATTEASAQPCTDSETSDSETCQGPPPSSPAIVETPPGGTLSGMGNIPATITPPSSAPAHLTRAQLLAKALSACRGRFKANHAKRVTCEKSARARYGHQAGKQKKKKKTVDRANGHKAKAER